MASAEKYQRIDEDEMTENCCFCQRKETGIMMLPAYKLRTQPKPIILHLVCIALSRVYKCGGENEDFCGFLFADISRELRRIADTVCGLCGKKGANIRCSDKGCKINFHLHCGLNGGSKHVLLDHMYKSYCPKHVNDCLCCLSPVTGYLTLPALNPTCCGKSVYFHRHCMEKWVNSAKAMARCPHCGDRNLFRKEVRQSEIQLLRRKPSYARTENREYPVSCSADVCLCPNGRLHHAEGGKRGSSRNSNANAWELITCRRCGHGSIHRKCGLLGKKIKTWKYCSACDLNRNSCV